MTLYTISKRTPATNWQRIRENFSHDQLESLFLELGNYDPNTLTAHYIENGDLIEYRADPQN